MGFVVQTGEDVFSLQHFLLSASVNALSLLIPALVLTHHHPFPLSAGSSAEALPLDPAT